MSILQVLGTASLCIVTFATACTRGPNEGNTMTLKDNRAKDEAAIRQLLDSLVTAIREKNLDRVMASYATELVAFDIVRPLRFVGSRAYRKPWQDLFEHYQSLDYEVRDLAITVGDDVAFSHSLNRIHGTMTNGQQTELWLRFSAGYRKTDGNWLIAHLQASVPADLATAKAMLELKP